MIIFNVKAMRKKIDYSLYLVTDREMIGNRSLSSVVLAAAKGGVSVVQIREKKCPTRVYLEIASEIKAILSMYDIPLIINDRLDIALACGADGVHIGQSDMPYPEARRLLGPDAIIGLTVETEEQALAAEALDADYLGVSTIFPTPTKTDTVHVWGIEGLENLADRSRHKLVAIGGLNQTNAAEMIKAGADGVAVVSAICAADNPEIAAREIRTRIDAARIQEPGQ